MSHYPSRHVCKVQPNLYTIKTWYIEGWNNMPPSVTTNCLRHSGILPAKWSTISASTSMFTNPHIEPCTVGTSDQWEGYAIFPPCSYETLST